MIAITGAPGTGKTTLATLSGLKTIHTDDFLRYSKDIRNSMLAKWVYSSDAGIIEGTLVPWVLREMLRFYGGVSPITKVVEMRHKWVNRPNTLGLGRASEHVLRQIEPQLRQLGIQIEEKYKDGSIQ